MFGGSTFKPVGGKQKTLLDFNKKNAKMTGNGKEFPIDFEDEDNIKPTILLKEVGIEILEGEIPNFQQIETYSRNLLNDIIKEIMPDYAIENL